MNATTKSSVDEHILFRANNALLLYVPPVILAFGIVGNALAFAVLTRRTMRGVSAYTYLTVLSVTDTLVLVIGLLRIWIHRLTKYDVRVLSSPWVCKLIMMAGYTASDYSVWLIVAVSAERFVAVAWPLSALHRGGAGVDMWRAAVVIVSLLIVLLTINGHFLWTVGITYVGGNSSYTNHTSQPKCTSLDGFERLVAFWPWVDAVIYSLLPLIALSVLNSLIICSVYRAKRRRCSLVATGSAKTAPSLPNSATPASTDSPYRSVTATNSRGGCTGAAAAAGGRDAERLTVMLLAVSFTFLATTLPSCVVLITMSLRSKSWSLDMTLSALVAQTVGELLMYANHSVNFYLYCATGCKFRHQLVAMFKRPSSAVQTSSSRRHYKQADSVVTKSSVVRSSAGPASTRVRLSSDTALYAVSNGNNTGSPQQLPNVRRHSNSDCKELSTRDDASAEQTSLLKDSNDKSTK